ncbi:MAG: NAD(P)/FAD-dependent oxidoreductase [Bacillota bacterium]
MKYLVLGAGAAGLHAARTIRKQDAHGEITVISKDSQIYSRPMLHYVISGDRLPDDICFVEKGFFERYNIHWLTGLEAVGLDAKGKAVRLSNGSEHHYGRLLIATGASSFLPPIENLDRGKQVFGLRNMEDAREITRISQNITTAAVIGAGPVGMSAAYALYERGNEVSVIEAAGNILSLQLDRQATARYELLFRKHGVKLFLNETVESVALDSDDNVLGVKLRSGEFVPCGMVIVATGVRPNIEFLNGTPVEIGRGIKVNRFQQTSVADIYAAGDVCESLESLTGKVTLTPVWPSAVRQGRVAGYNMAGVPKQLEDNFALKNSMTFFGLPSVSLGYISPPDDSFQELICQDEAIYKKFILKDGRIWGAIIQGEVSNAGLIGKLIKDGIDISAYENSIFELTYADFFVQKENGDFYFTHDRAAGSPK